MAIRLFIDQALAAGQTAALSEGQAHYLRAVMRCEIGAGVLVFNGRDGEFVGALEALSKKGGVVRLAEQTRRPEPSPDLHLLFAPIKRGPMEMIIQKATELGVAALQPVITERVNASKLNIERLSAIAIEAAEQCERLDAPVFSPSVKLNTLLDDWPADRALIFCDEAGDDPSLEWGGRDGRAAPLAETLAAGAFSKAAILIGPEGGFSPVERERLRAQENVTPVTLGPRVLRADTAAIAAIAIWQSHSGDFKRR